jgi:PAS domain S-box-containing protein
VTPFVGRGGRLGSLNSERASEAAGLAATAIAAVAFVGWSALLSAWGVGVVAVKPLVALCLAVLGLAVAHPGKGWRIAFAAGVAVAAAAALRLAADLFAADLGAGRWLEASWLQATWLQATTAASMALGLAGGGLALARFERQRFAATVLAVLAGAVAVLAILGYVTGIDTLDGSMLVSLPLPPFPTAVALLLVVCGIVLRIGAWPVLRTPRPLPRLLLALGCTIVAPLLLFGAYAGSRMAEAQLGQVRKDLLTEARTISAEIDRQLIAATEKLQVLAASPSLREGDFAAFQRQAEAALAGPRKGLILLVDPATMEQRMNTWLPYGAPLPKAIIREPVERAFASGKPQYTGVIMGPTAQQPVFGIVIPVTIDGGKRYSLAASPDPKAFGRLVSALALPSGWQAAVTDAERHILARSGQEDGVIGTTLPQAQWHPAGDSGTFVFTGPDGQPALQAYARSDITGWVTAVWAPEALLEAPVRALWRALGWLALLAFALVAALALWLGRLIAGAVDQAAGAAAALGEGAPLPAGTTPVAEAAAWREAVEHRLRESEKTYRAMFDVSGVGKIEVVPHDGRFLRANAAMCRFVGYTEAELLDMTVWDLTHPDERESQREPVRRLISGEASEFDVEKRYIRKDGTAVWARTTANVVCDEHGVPVRDIAVIQDIDAHKRAEQALRASRDRLELALDAARLGSWQFDAARRMFSGDARGKEIFGVDAGRDEAPFDDILLRLHPDDVELVLKAIAAALDPADPKRAVSQFRLLGPRGEVRWVETLGQAYFEGEGPERRGVTIVGTCQDVTARKEREEKEHLLMREINHRAKNMLSVVHAIAHQTVTKNPEDFITRFSERIQALSANQDLLVRNEWNGVEVADLVHAQLAPFVGLIGSRIAVHGPRLRLTASSAQALGLALHELATNAGKYGALSNDRGRVDVAWGANGESFTMHWTESAGPPVCPPKRRGFGSTVIDVMAGRSLGGEVDLDYAPSGVTWRLTCPAANALEPGEPDGRRESEGREKSEGKSAQQNQSGENCLEEKTPDAAAISAPAAKETADIASHQFKTELRGR